jgi:tetratricopeptide (TPR) repeat protein
MDWSDREFRHVIDMKNPPLDAQEEALRARLRLADSLHDRMLDDQAADVMQGAVDQLEGNRDLSRRAVQNLHLNMTHCLARSYFYRSSAVGQKQDFAKQRELLEKAIQEDPSDGDVLIALYRLPDQTAEQRQKTLDLIAAAIQLSRNQIDEEPDHWTAYNQMAWLVANTEGDFDEAVRLSEKSVELIRAAHVRDPQSQGEIKSLEWGELLGGHLDTLAHCYAAKGDFAAAVKTQTEANRLLPYSNTIANKLTFFRSKLPKTEQKDSP